MRRGLAKKLKLKMIFPKKCRKGAKFAAHTAFSARRRKLTDVVLPHILI
jgi:hypothetical protein